MMDYYKKQEDSESLGAGCYGDEAQSMTHSKRQVESYRQKYPCFSAYSVDVEMKYMEF